KAKIAIETHRWGVTETCSVNQLQRRLRSALALTLLGVVVFVATAINSVAQAWVPPRGVGSFSLTYQRISNTRHRSNNGVLLERGQSTNMGLYLEGEYAITNRLSVSAGLPYVFAKFTSNVPPAPPLPYLPVDQCHCWHAGWQDFGFTARYNLVGGAFALTP